MSVHEHTIATITICGQTYEVDWPFDPENERRRHTGCAAIFDAAGRELTVIEPTTSDLRVEAAYATADDVVQAAKAWLLQHRGAPRIAPRFVRWCNGVRPWDGPDAMPRTGVRP